MGKNILVTYYTQTGQLKDILDHFTAPLVKAGHQVEFLQIFPEKPFPFPWPVADFFDTVPESVDHIATPLKPWDTQLPKYDLVILGWQPWNLSPSIPFNSLMNEERFKALIKDTPVITIAGCRNMWINAQEQNKKLIKAAGAHLVGNITLMDRNLNHLSYFTIFHWLGKGRKDRKWGIFPRPGVSDKDIKNTYVFGETVNIFLQSGNWDRLQPALIKQGAVRVKYQLMYIEETAGKIFKKWVNIIKRYPHKRKQILAWYRHYLAVALLVASPIILSVDLIFVRPFKRKIIREKIKYYSSVAIK